MQFYFFKEKKCLYPAFFGLLLSCFCFPFNLKAVQAVVMHNVFYAPQPDGSLSPYIEAYWQIDPMSIAFKKENQAWVGKIKTEISILSDTGIVASEKYILTTIPVSDENKVLAQNILDLRRYAATPGKFSIELKLTEERNEGIKVFVYKDSFSVRKPGQEPIISDIQLVDTSVASAEENIFQRNNKIQIPLCASFIDDNRKNLHYYTEIYSTNRVNEMHRPVVCKVFISRKDADFPVNELIRTDTVPASLLHIAEGKLSVASLSSGNYFLNVVLENELGKLTEKKLFFQLINTHPVAPEGTAGDSLKSEKEDVPTFLDLTRTFLGKYNPSQIRAILKMLAPIAGPEEKNSINGFLKRPDDTYSRYFVYNFWLRRDKTNPAQAWKEYSEKVKQVNKLFGSSMLAGYENDRGTIYLKYGAPTERFSVENENGAYPYEIWQYNSLPNATNAVFLFYRPGLISNDYKLLHSTVSGEVRNSRWRTVLYLSGASPDPSSSRAEYYLNIR